MKKLLGTCAVTFISTGACLAQDASAPVMSPGPTLLTRSADAEGIAVIKSTGNLLRGIQNDPTPWECEPTLLYAARYSLTERDANFVLDFCSVLSLSKRGAFGSNIFDVASNVARERPKTEQKLKRYRDAKQFFLEVPGMRLAYQGPSGNYRLNWHVPKFEVLGRATDGLMGEYANEPRTQKDPNSAMNRFSSTAQVEDYKRTGMEFFDRKYGKSATVALNHPMPWPTVDQISLLAMDDKTGYALENLTSNQPQRDIDGTTFFQLDRTGNLFFSVEASGNDVRVIPLFLEAWLYKKIVRIPLSGTSYTITCKTSGLFGKSFKCE